MLLSCQVYNIEFGQGTSNKIIYFFRFHQNPWEYVSDQDIEALIEKLQNCIDVALSERSARYQQTIDTNHDVLRALWRRTPEQFPCNRKIECHTLPEQLNDNAYRPSSNPVRRIEARIQYPISLRLFISRSRALYEQNGAIKAQRYIQRVTVSFMKTTVVHISEGVGDLK